MLEQVCAFIHNYFEYERYSGEFTVSNGAFTIDLHGGGFLKDGQRFRVIGSALNDGVYTFHPSGISNDDSTVNASLEDETFTGVIVSMAVPKALVNLCYEISAWVEANAAIIDSPYQSESFGGYSYTKAGDSGSSSSGVPRASWQTKYGSVLNQWRKIS